MNKNKLAFRLSKVLLSIVIIGLIVALSVNIIKTVRTPYTSSAYFAYNNISKMISTLYSDAKTLVLQDKYASVNVQNTDDNMRKLTYLGHSAFFIEKNGDGILIDPFITGNPLADFNFKEKRITHIVVTHAHHDHLGDAIEISKHSGAPIIAVFELANYCMQKGAKAIPINIGAKLKFNWGSVKFLPAVHSSSNPDLPYGGTAASLLFDIDGTTIYHAGDTSLMPDFSMIGELYNPHYALLPIGGFYTMDMQDAAIAAKMLYAKKVIPMHYNTFPGIKVDIQKFVDSLEAQGQKCLPLKANEYVKI